MCSADDADYWPEIVAEAKYPSYIHRQKNIPAHSDHKAALKALIARYTKNMTKLVNTDVAVL